MNQQAIFTPFFAMMWLTFVVWVYMYSRRIPFIARSRLGADQLVPLELARLSPPQVSNPSRHSQESIQKSDAFLPTCALSFWYSTCRHFLFGHSLGIFRLPRAAQHRALHRQHRSASVLAIRAIDHNALAYDRPGCDWSYVVMNRVRASDRIGHRLRPRPPDQCMSTSGAHAERQERSTDRYWINGTEPGA